HLKEQINENHNVFLVSYSKLDALKITELRRTLKNAKAQMYVSKNRIAKLVLKDLEKEGLVGKVSDQSAFVWSNSDSVEVSKILVEFAKTEETVTVQGGVLEGRVITEDEVKKLSDLPSKDVLFAMLLGTIQAPLTRLAGALNAKSRDLLSILKQLSEKKGGN
ncbi:MAG: 50S ribosomal protein L10, partial [Candidatus Omnitrophica bacterium]|nr:50S ribosomal protein L10 [Candidatus Omnitrophota bacterium]